MSIRIEHGYRLAPGTDPTEFLTRVSVALDPVRDVLDARLYARLLAAVFDDRDPAATITAADLHAQARAAFTATVGQGAPGERVNDPHEVTIDISNSTDAEGHHYALFGAEQHDYYPVWEALREVEPFGYWNSTDPPADVTPTAWAHRRAAWEWLIAARRISDVTTRWALRPTSEPHWDIITAPDTVLANLPSRSDRAHSRAQDASVAELVASAPGPFGEPGGPTMRDVFAAMRSDRVPVLAAAIEPTLRHITAADLSDPSDILNPSDTLDSQGTP